MRSIGWRLPILAMSILSLNRAQARAQEVLYLETADWIPTASVLSMPTSYVAAGPAVFPTSYAVPTVHATAYLTESALVTPTTYLAPSYYGTYPTTFRSSAIVDAAVMPTLYARTTSTRCCGEEVDTPIVSALTRVLRAGPVRPTRQPAPAPRLRSYQIASNRLPPRSFPDASSRLSGQLLPHRPRPGRPHRGRASPTWTPCRIPPRSSSRRPDLARPPPRPSHLV